MSEFPLGPVASFAPSSVTRVVVSTHDGLDNAVAVIRIADDFYVIGDRCSHADVSLSDGTLWTDECELECPKHGSAFSLRSGEPQSFPATRPVPVYGTRRDGEDLVLLLPETGSL